MAVPPPHMESADAQLQDAPRFAAADAAHRRDQVPRATFTIWVIAVHVPAAARGMGSAVGGTCGGLPPQPLLRVDNWRRSLPEARSAAGVAAS